MMIKNKTMLLNKEEAVMIIKDLAEMAIMDSRVAEMFPTKEAQDAYKLGVGHLEMEFLKRIYDYI